jgi:hypothetical protein
LCSLPNAACSSATLPLSLARSRATSIGPLDRRPAGPPGGEALPDEVRQPTE